MRTDFTGLGAKVAYRTVGELFTVVCEHGGGEGLQLNPAGGRLIARL
ncbi:MAG: hypothetical protein JRI55_29530, partial [Deltaproteobacteria bacterium]|nr:hypothetical protein [Deltaproteobacteria bacterium]